MPRYKSCTTILIDAIMYVNNSSLLSRSVLPTYSAPQQIVSTTRSTKTRRKENIFEKRRLPASACLFSLESGVELSRTAVRTTLIQPSQTPTTHDAMTWFKLTMNTDVSFSERPVIANISSAHRSKRALRTEVLAKKKSEVQGCVACNPVKLYGGKRIAGNNSRLWSSGVNSCVWYS